jgi:hypothetical protein
MVRGDTSTTMINDLSDRMQHYNTTHMNNGSTYAHNPGAGQVDSGM